MITDYFTTIADGVALSTAAPATAKFGSDIYVGANSAIDIGDGIPLFLVITVDTTATSGGSATLVLELVTATNAALTGSPVVLYTTRSFTVAELVAGTVLGIFSLPRGTVYKDYIGLRQVVGTAALTAGKLNAAFTDTPPNWRSLPDGI